MILNSYQISFLLVIEGVVEFGENTKTELAKRLTGSRDFSINQVITVICVGEEGWPFGQLLRGEENGEGVNQTTTENTMWCSHKGETVVFGADYKVRMHQVVEMEGAVFME